jgi:hypothetical protein
VAIRFSTFAPAVGVVAITIAAALAVARARAADDGHESPEVSWAVAESDAAPRVTFHARSRDAAHRGEAGERIRLEASTGTTLRLQAPIGRAAVIDELRCSAWVRASRPDVRLGVRVTLPGYRSRKTGRVVETLVPGTVSRDADRWEPLEVTGLPQALARQLPALRLEHGPDGTLAGAVATHVVLDLYAGPGAYDVAIDDLVVEGAVPPAATQADAHVIPAAAVGPDAPPADPPAGLARGVLEVDGLPFFPRSIEHNGEPLAALAELGFNCVQLAEPASRDVLEEARHAGLWVICPPPAIPDVDLRDPESVPVLRNWDRVLAWDLGSGLSAADAETLAERGRRVRACDPRAGRPLVAAADSGLRTLSRHVDMLVARRTVLGTSLELDGYVTWLRERPRLARPGTPLLATLATEIDHRAARQAAAIAGVGGRGLAVDPESLCLASFAAVAAGARGILFSSSARLDGDDRESRKRAAACREMNLRLEPLEPWGAAGRFAADAQASHPDVRAVVMEAARARIVVAWRSMQGAQIVAQRYGAGDVPDGLPSLTLLVPGVPEAHRAWEVAPGGLKPLTQRRVTGGVAVTLDSFLTHALVLVSGDPAVTGHVQERIRELAPVELVSARELAAIGLADTADLLGRLPPEAFSGPPPVAAGPMLAAANRLATDGESLAAAEPGEAVAKLRRAAAITGQFERRIWENGVRADGSMVASPLAVADSTLAEQWRFVTARAAAGPGPELLRGGGMEGIEDLAANGWRHFALPQSDLRTAVEIVRQAPASGSGALRLTAAAPDPAAPPVVVETPPVWVTTPPVAVPGGTLVEISASVRVPETITGSVDGLLVFDSLGGPALAERVARTPGWRRLVLHRIAPADGGGEPLVVTFALTGLGSAEIDEVSIRALEPGAGGGTPATAVSAATPGRGFPSPGELLAPRPPQPAAPAPPSGLAWPGTNLGWPKIMPFGPSANDPPPGPGGGTIDPFKRARTQQSQEAGPAAP